MDSLQNKEVLKDLIIAFLSGKSTAEETAQLKKHLHLSRENQLLFQEIKEAWVSASSYTPVSMEPITDNAWKQIQVSINTVITPQPFTQKDSGHIFRRMIRIAAGWAALIALGSLSTFLMMSQKEQQNVASVCVVSTPLGSKSQITLPDGTRVWLNAGTTIRYPGSFSDAQRDLYLTGEAFFKVKTDKHRPFVVHAGKLNIKALGTSFNVKAYPSENKVSTTLVEGIVKLEDIGNARKKFIYTLKPNQILTYYTSEPLKTEKIMEETKPTEKVMMKVTSISTPVVVSKDINTTLYTSWKDKRWIIDGENLDDLAVMLERRYDMKVSIASEELKSYKFSGTIENETMEQVLNYLSLTTPLKYEMQKGHVTLRINQSILDQYKSFLKSK
jgi:transmembrane sensor